MKPLKPSMKENKRYLLVRGTSKGKTGKNLKENIEKAIHDFIGAKGMSKAALNFIKTNKDYAIVSVNRQAVNDVRACLVIWPEKIEVVRVSGTLKGLKVK